MRHYLRLFCHLINIDICCYESLHIDHGYQTVYLCGGVFAIFVPVIVRDPTCNHERNAYTQDHLLAACSITMLTGASPDVPPQAEEGRRGRHAGTTV